MTDLTDLSDYGLALDDTVRWQHKPRGNWHISHVRGINSDGSVTVATDRGMRALPAHRLQVHRTGPKGNAKWLPVIPSETESSTQN